MEDKLLPQMPRETGVLSHALRFVFMGCFNIIVAVFGLSTWFKADLFTVLGPYPSGWAGYDVRSLVGLLMFTIFFPPGIILVYVGITTVASFKSHMQSLALLTALGFVLIAVGSIGVVWGSETLKCFIILCPGTTEHNEAVYRPEAGVAFRSGLGLAFLFSLVPCGTLLLVKAGRRAFGDNAFNGTQSDRRSCWSSTISWTYLLSLTFIVFWFIISLYMPNSLESFLPMRIAKNAMIISSHNYTLCRTEPHRYTCPDFPWSWVYTRNLIWSDSLVLKLYPSNIFFYGYMLLLLTVAALARCYAIGRKFTKSRNRTFRGFTHGEMGFLFLTAAMLAMFFLYWVRGHNYKGRYNDISDNTILSEQWFRSFGQLSIAFLSLCILPVSRYSIMHLILGTSWESSIWAHKLFGYGVLTGTIGHIVGWFIRCGEVGSFPQCAFTVPVVESIVYRDDYTIPLITVISLIFLISMGVLSVEPLRRRCYELFYYPHITGFYVMTPVVLWHAAAAWEFFLPGLTLWLVDWMMRLYRRGSPVEVVSAVTCGSFVEICFRQASLRASPGQYVFVNVPDLSLLQWHPFSVKCEGKGYYTLYVKSMGENTWTEGLLSLVKERGWRFTINVEGPCGHIFKLDDYKNIIFVAGGIGITPCASLYSYIQDQAAVNPRGPTVKLLWSLRDAELLTMMSYLFCEIDAVENYITSAVEELPFESIELFFTGNDRVRCMPTSVVVVHERLDVSTRVPQLIRKEDVRDTLIFVCGPPTLVEVTRNIANSMGVSFHEEVFLL
uniref:Putative ferric reductase n=1 Tax=Trypanosoma congolense (strain IL3000) TaxID=1068625 RepID=G0V075_TRYCI|nr:putative ferric reductase [Trypanosoma congolense IL3000]